MDLLAQLELAAVWLGGSPWLLLLVLGLTVLDGVFPPMPSETILITAAVLAAGDVPYVLLLVAVAAVGALLGDLLAYTIGRHVPVHRLPGLRSGAGQRALGRARDALHRRGTTLVIVGRFIPVGRVAVNASAGALGFTRGRFVLAAGAAAVLWAGYNAVVGIAAQSVLGGSPLLSVVVGVISALLLSLVIEVVLQRTALARAEPEAPYVSAHRGQ